MFSSIAYSVALGTLIVKYMDVGRYLLGGWGLLPPF